MRKWWSLLAFFVVAGCQERLAVPSSCPEYCPGQGLIIRDTIIEAAFDRDSSFSGYVGFYQTPVLLVSNGLPAGDARGYAVFGALPDSLFVLGVRYSYTIDSMQIRLNLVARDTAVRNLRIIVHRIPLVDSTATVADLDQYFTAATAVDSVEVADTLRSGSVLVRIAPEAWPRLLPDESDSTRFGVGFRISAPVPTGVRLGSNFGGLPPTYLTYAQVPTTDTTLRRQTITIPADTSTYYIQEPPLGAAGNLFLGGRVGSRTLLRFQLPRNITDSSTVVRATLELTPTGPVPGLPHDPAVLQVLAPLVDIGAKSPAFGGAAGLANIDPGATGVLRVEVGGPVSTWFGPNGLPTALLLGLAPEAGTFARPEFHSTRSSSGRPRLWITFAQSARPGFP